MVRQPPKATEKGRSAFKDPLSENCHYLSYLVVPCKSSLARLSLFDLTCSSTWATVFFPLGSTCQKHSQVTAQHWGCLRQRIIAAHNGLVKSQSGKTGEGEVLCGFGKVLTYSWGSRKLHKWVRLCSSPGLCTCSRENYEGPKISPEALCLLSKVWETYWFWESKESSVATQENAIKY